MNKERILVIDDEELNRRLLEAILVGEGYDVLEAGDGAQGLEIIATTPVDLVLLDVMMPGMSGFEVCRRIRNDLGQLHLPVVFVTALHDRDARIRGKDVGADEFLTKPVDDLELLVRSRALLRLKAAHDANEKQRRLMSAILDSMGEGVVAVDETGYSLWNPAAEQILGPVESWPSVAAWPDEACPATPLARALDGDVVVDERMALPRSGTQPRHVSIGARSLARGGGRAAVAVVRDVTELVHLDQFRQEMTSLLVHDLKNVMLIVGGNVDYVLDAGTDGSAEVRESLADAKDAAARAIRLIANLMDVSRLEHSALALEIGHVDPGALFSAAVRQRGAQLRTRGIEAIVDCDDCADFEADRDLVLRVIDNVLDNAVRYTGSGGRIAMRAVSTRDGRIQLRIGNTGTPIPLEDRARIFEKYGQASESSVARGTMNAGLGLYFCRLAIAAHEGRIWVESEPDLETVFVIEIPGRAGTKAARRLTMRMVATG